MASKFDTTVIVKKQAHQYKNAPLELILPHCTKTLVPDSCRIYDRGFFVFGMKKGMIMSPCLAMIKQKSGLT